MASTSVAEEKTRRMERILKEAIERYEHELMGGEERMLLLDRIRRLQRKLLAS